MSGCLIILRIFFLTALAWVHLNGFAKNSSEVLEQAFQNAYSNSKECAWAPKGVRVISLLDQYSDLWWNTHYIYIELPDLSQTNPIFDIRGYNDGTWDNVTIHLRPKSETNDEIDSPTFLLSEQGQKDLKRRMRVLIQGVRRLLEHGYYVSPAGYNSNKKEYSKSDLYNLMTCAHLIWQNLQNVSQEKTTPTLLTQH